MSNTGLGRGLDSLLPEEKSEDNRLKNIPTDKIEPNPHQPRQEFDPEKLAQLTSSIEQQGVIEPIVVQPEKDNTHTLIAGERRWRAACQAEIESIPAIIKNISAERSLSIALIENIQRENLNPIEEARAYQEIKTNQDLNQEEVARLVGKNRTTVANRLRLLNLPKTVKKALVEEKISAGHGRALLALEDEDQVKKLLNKIIDKGLSVRRTEQLIQSVKKKPQEEEQKETEENKRPPTHFEHLEAELEDNIGAPVNIETDSERKAGHLKIFFNDPDEFELLRQRLKTINPADSRENTEQTD
ncbi:MAG: ParB/RepB/Spo0J family partition protein [bacterium]